MTALSMRHQAVLFAHLAAFALMLSAVLREDLRRLATRRIDAPRLVHSARAVSIGPAVLWSTGLALAALRADSPRAAWAGRSR
jgi:hypothetical protein